MFGLGADREVRRDREPRRLRFAGAHAARPRHHGGLRATEKREREGTRKRATYASAIGLGGESDMRGSILLLPLLLCGACSSSNELQAIRSIGEFTIGTVDPSSLAARARIVERSGGPCICGKICKGNDTSGDNVSVLLYTETAPNEACRITGYAAWVVPHWPQVEAPKLIPNEPASAEIARARYGPPTYFFHGPGGRHLNSITMTYCQRPDGKVLNEREAALYSGRVFLYGFAFNGRLTDLTVGYWPKCVDDPFPPPPD
jgi:hypothetical protein